MKRKIIIKNVKDGHHLNSKYWKDYKNNLPDIPSDLFNISIGILLGDACMYNKGLNTLIKCEQGALHKEYLFHLYDLFKLYTFNEPYERIKDSKIKSYSFRTFSHPSFNPLWDLFYKSNKKIIFPNLILDYLTPIGLAYWIMDDGSLANDKRTMIIHTQSYSKLENEMLSNELNIKWSLNSKVISHKNIYYVIKIPGTSHLILRNLIEPYIHSSMMYKLPKNN